MKAHSLSLDIIRTLPSSIIETILCRVSIKEAARTSILSKEWRYKWTKIPKLEFYSSMLDESTDDENEVSVSDETIDSERKKIGKRCKLFYAIYQVLLMHQGPVDEFDLALRVDKTCVEIDHIICYLSRNNTLKKLTLQLFEEKVKYRLPSSVFSWHHLTDLDLHNCDLYLPPTFNGFGSLASLCLNEVCISKESLLHFLSNCPLLKQFTLFVDDEHLVDDVHSTVIDLFKCLPVIEDLSIWSSSIRCFVIDSVSQELPTLLNHLKYFFMEFMSFGDDNGLPFLPLLIKCSPNIETIRLGIDSKHAYGKIDSSILGKYSDIWLEHLIDLQIDGFANMKFDLEFLKLILAKSPKLKEVYLDFVYVLDKKKESKMLKFLLRSPPASPVVKIIVNYSPFGW